MSKKGIVLNGRAREIVCNVDEYFKSEKDYNVALVHDLKTADILTGLGPYGNVTLTREIFNSILVTLQSAYKVSERVKLATGISNYTISRIRYERKDAEAPEANSSKVSTPKKKPLRKLIVGDNFEIAALQNIINSIYRIKKEIPTLKKILAAAKEELQFPGGKMTLRRIMVDSLGYKNNCQSNGIDLIERCNSKAWRSKYLRRIHQNDILGADKKPIVYLFETWIHAHYTIKKCWQTSTETGAKKNDSVGCRWVIAGGENGFINGALLMFKTKLKTSDNHDKMYAANFMKWVSQNLIPNLPKNAIVVMDNAAYHSMEVSMAPNVNTKKEMQSWLKEKNIEFEECFTKAELYQSIKRHKPPINNHIDNLFSSHGFEVLRLPPYNCDLNPIEYIWNLIKCRVANSNVQKLESQIERLTLEAIASITRDDWQREMTHVKLIERQYRKREQFEDEDEKFSFIIQTGESSCDEDEDYLENNAEITGIELQHSD
ncbi:uncharacterized protein LOC123874810 [Maniola jurtina]|uniref:uncharacterized protein LOC123874810 n=1 Tax=Maniola jurtina TaxID=191418 RepID=UPI001E686B69|nr:uncharacterized protein LOC123874810 [Maniola jurtina]